MAAEPTLFERIDRAERAVIEHGKTIEAAAANIRAIASSLEVTSARLVLAREGITEAMALLAQVSGGDWSTQTAEWRSNVIAWRAKYRPLGD